MLACNHSLLKLCTGGVSKGDLRRFLSWGAVNLGYASLADVVAAAPTAELEPIREGTAPQTDEEDMGMTYEVCTCASNPISPSL